MKRCLLSLLSLLFLQSSCDSKVLSRDVKKSHGDAAAEMITHDSLPQPGKNIMTIFQDSRNNYWFGSWETGLYKYDGKTILHYTTKNGLPHDRVEDIREDKAGNLFVNTPGGLCRFDGKTFTILKPKEGGTWALHPDDLWFKLFQFDGHVYRYDGKDLHMLKLPGNALGDDWVAKHPNNPIPYAVYTIYKDRQGYVWFGTAALGACRYNGKSFDWISEEDVTELHYGPSNGVRSIIEDKEGYFWFNSAYRYKVYDKAAPPMQTFYTREKSIGNLDGRPDSDFWEYLSIARDNDDALWIATYWNGVWKYDGSKTIHYPIQVNGEDIHTFCIYKDNHGDLWLGTHENGAYKFNGKSFERFVP
jgi:ligand-binding sensor domain-containing protein